LEFPGVVTREGGRGRGSGIMERGTRSTESKTGAKKGKSPKKKKKKGGKNHILEGKKEFM